MNDDQAHVLAPNHRLRPWTRAAGFLALAAAFVLGLALSWRLQATMDLGIHLAAGETFLREGHIVDNSRFLYTDQDPAHLTPADWGTLPDTWYDANTAVLHYVNDHYGSQIVMAAAHRLGGMTGLCVLNTLLWAVILGLSAVTMLRLRVPMGVTALAMGLFVVVIHERMNMRPEVIFYLLLAAQLYVLMTLRIGAKVTAALVLLQLALVQCHIAWPLAIVVTGCFWTPAAVQVALAHWRRPSPEAADAGASFRWLSIALAGQVLAAFVNPWGYRSVVASFGMAEYLSRYHLTGNATSGDWHPWTTITEFLAPLAPGFDGLWATYALYVLLALAGLGLLACLLQRRWAWGLVIAVGTMLCLQMRRGLGPGPVLLIPPAVAALAQFGARFGFIARPAARVAYVALCAAVALGAVATTALVVSNRFYLSEKMPWRFGAGASRLQLPLDAAEVLRKLPTDVNAFVSFNASSNLMYFSGQDGHFRKMPVLTTDATMMPAVMQETLDIGSGKADLAPFARRYNIGIVALDMTPPWTALLRKLSADRDWTLLHLDARLAVVVRKGLTHLTPDWIDHRRFLRRVLDSDPDAASAVTRAAASLRALGDYDFAIAFLRAASAQLPDSPEVRNDLGLFLAARGQRRLVEMTGHQAAGRPREADDCLLLGRADWQEARDCFASAAKMRPDYAQARVNLANIETQLRALADGQVIRMADPF